MILERVICWFPSFYSWGNWGPERSRNPLKVMALAKFWIPGLLPFGPRPLCLKQQKTCRIASRWPGGRQCHPFETSFWLLPADEGNKVNDAHINVMLSQDVCMGCLKRSSVGPLMKEKRFHVALKGAVSPLSARTGTLAFVTSVPSAECPVVDRTLPYMINTCLVKKGRQRWHWNKFILSLCGYGPVFYKDLIPGGRELRGVGISHLSWLVSKLSPHDAETCQSHAAGQGQSWL